ncbi:hypothetical protein BO94DRAFT_195272 [Aspergillus sclerotioniger CBS 115572]|uniref:Uncharacterized protein n=1 Tax=Aspergillus sclerotioniger CBS 115572 TaxID=1450535 RepID=A0A317VW59_9EURO|nr:hypothetical protein BO94DRAFT_195272 [Aspergillus sclerotioniger CBS 115572]PWY77257.1 hypothetical protein BO94DRAFT_195272 [Aspergillus sclerotioniger CBS 115572]
MADTKEVMSPSVVISPPLIDVDLYKSFDELHQRTVDKILSDEASFDTSFDDYSGSDGIIANDDQLQSGGDQTSKLATAKVSEPADSPYFPTKKRSKAQRTAQRHISRNDSQDDEGYDDDRDTSAGMDLGGPNTHATVNGEDLDDVSEEDIVFASVNPDRRMELLTFISSHSFMKKGEYPVPHSARRRFVRDLRRQSLSVGMKEADLDQLVAYVKRTYLELYGNSYVNWDGSQFGDEISDEPRSQESRSKLSKKEKKRKRTTGDDQEPAMKEDRKGSSKRRMSHEAIADGNGIEHEVAELDPTGSISKPLAGQPQVTDYDAAAGGEEMPKVTIDLCKSDDEGTEPSHQQEAPIKSSVLEQPPNTYVEATEKRRSLPPRSESKEKSCSTKQKKSAHVRPSTESPNKRSMNAQSSPKSPPTHHVGDGTEKDIETHPFQVSSSQDESTSVAEARQHGSSVDETQQQGRVPSKKEKNKRKRDNRKLRKKKYNIFRTSLSKPQGEPSTAEADMAAGCVGKTPHGIAGCNVVTADDLAILDEAFWDLEDF